jgi:hypothetical protein
MHRFSFARSVLVLASLCGCSSPPAVAPDAAPADAAPDASDDGGVAPSSCADIDVPTDVATRGAWDDDFFVAGLTGLDGVTPIVRDVAPVPGSEDAVVVGYFRWAGRQRVEGVARLSDHALAPLAGAAELPLATEGYAAAAVAPDGAIYLAPYRMDDTRVGTLVRIDDAGVQEIGTFTGNVRSLVILDGALWALGTIAITGGPRGVAIYEGGAWHGVVGGDPDGPAYEVLQRSNGDLVVGGEFTQIGGVSALRVAAFDGAVWTALDMPEAGRVIALAEDASNTLWAGGVFSLAPATIASASVARWTGTAWEIASGGVAAGDAFGAVSDLIVDGNGIVVVGCFDHVGGALRAEGIARVEGGEWTALDDGTQPVASHWFAPFVCGFEPDPNVVWLMPRQRVSRVGSELVIGGAFGGIDGVASQSVIARAGDSFVAIGAPGRGVSGQVVDLDVGGDGCTAYALMGASNVGGAPVTGAVYTLDDTGWSVATAPIPTGARCHHLAVDAAAHVLLACGEEPEADGTPRGYVLRSTSTGWQRVGEVLPTNVQDVVIAPDGTPWAVLSAERGNIARVMENELEIVEGDFDGPPLYLAFGPARADGSFDAVVGGIFMNVGTTAATRIARWDGTAWSALGDGLSSAPSAIAVGADVVYAATQDEGNAGRLVLGRFDGTSWSDIATPANGLGAPYMETTHTFTSLILRGDVLLASGYVWPDGSGRNAFAYADGRFEALGGGASAISVDAMTVVSGAIVLGGSIAEVGMGASTEPSVGVARLRW